MSIEESESIKNELADLLSELKIRDERLSIFNSSNQELKNELNTKEKLQIERLRAKLEKNLGSIADMTRLPAALFVVDVKAEHIAVKEAQKLNIPVFAMVDTNSDPRPIDFVIPANDDASKSIDKVLSLVSSAIVDGLSDRKAEKEDTKETEAKTEATANE